MRSNHLPATWLGASVVGIDIAIKEPESEKQSALRRDLESHWREHNTAQDGGTAIEAEYLEVIAVKA